MAVSADCEQCLSDHDRMLIHSKDKLVEYDQSKPAIYRLGGFLPRPRPLPGIDGFIG
jgi:hypothetical protein